MVCNSRGWLHHPRQYYFYGGFCAVLRTECSIRNAFHINALPFQPRRTHREESSPRRQKRFMAPSVPGKMSMFSRIQSTGTINSLLRLHLCFFFVLLTPTRVVDRRPGTSPYSSKGKRLGSHTLFTLCIFWITDYSRATHIPQSAIFGVFES